MKGEREREREEDEEYIRRKEYERKKRIEEENEEELNYRMKQRAGNQRSERNEYNGYTDERKRDDYKLDSDRIALNTGKLDIRLPKSIDKNENEEGLIQCHVSGYLYLNIKDIELIKNMPTSK